MIKHIPLMAKHTAVFYYGIPIALMGKTNHDTIANLSKCSDEEINAIKFGLKHKKELATYAKGSRHLKAKQGLSIGIVWPLVQIARRLGIAKALGSSREAKLILWLVMSALIESGSRLSAVRLAQRHAVCDVLGVDAFNEDNLYAAMDWLASHQVKIENSLYRFRYGDQKPILYLYDVTSTYLEGVQNVLAAFGYNRDGKKGKMQLVIGLLTDDVGRPISIQVFEGNTSDPKTVADQVKKLTGRFGVEKVTFVGDRGMIKNKQAALLEDADFYHITAITKSQIEKLIKDDVFQLSLFDENLCEVTVETDKIGDDGDGTDEKTDDNESGEGADEKVKKELRYILRRNPQRADEIRLTRNSKLERLQDFVDDKNGYLAEHPKAWPSVALRDCLDKAKSLKIDRWVSVDKSESRWLIVLIDPDQLDEVSRLDGCYVIKSDVPRKQGTTQALHDRYKDLKEVEWAFRTMKTTLIEMRGIFVRTESHTHAHVFIVMPAYLIAYELRQKWTDIEMTIEEGLAELASISTIFVEVEGVMCQTVPEPRATGQQLLSELEIMLPDVIPHRNIKIEPRKKIKGARRKKKVNK